MTFKKVRGVRILYKYQHRSLLLVALLCSVISVSAQQWPQRPIRIIVGNAPGGSSDISVRLVSEIVTRSLKQQMIVDNRAGATGGIAMELVARATPDGYTLLVVGDSSLYQPIIKPSLPYHPQKSFTPITVLTKQPIVIVAHAGLKVKTIAELVQKIKTSTNPMAYATPNAGGTQSVAGEAFFKMAGVKLTNIPYKGGGLAIVDILSGQVPVGVMGSAPLVPHLSSGQIILLAVTSKQRSAVLPQVPTLEELGYAGLDISQWFGLLAPAGLSKKLNEQLNTEFRRALADNEVKRKLNLSALEPVGGSSDEFAQRIQIEGVVWAKIAKEVGL